ncbi:MAG: AN1-type zinc finger domain-containing protein [Candidatus Hodarchaeales archaeon]
MSRNLFSSERNIVWYLLVGLIFLPLISSLIFSENHFGSMWLSGLAAILFSILMGYFLVYKGRNQERIFNRKHRLFTKDDGFSPVVLKPSKLNKETILKGMCSSCQINVIYGFTCSYCKLYFCSDHRLPEKHNCLGLTS